MPAPTHQCHGYDNINRHDSVVISTTKAFLRIALGLLSAKVLSRGRFPDGALRTACRTSWESFQHLSVIFRCVGNPHCVSFPSPVSGKMVALPAMRSAHLHARLESNRHQASSNISSLANTVNPSSRSLLAVITALASCWPTSDDCCLFSGGNRSVGAPFCVME